MSDNTRWEKMREDGREAPKYYKDFIAFSDGQFRTIKGPIISVQLCRAVNVEQRSESPNKVQLPIVWWMLFNTEYVGLDRQPPDSTELMCSWPIYVNYCNECISTIYMYTVVTPSDTNREIRCLFRCHYQSFVVTERTLASGNIHLQHKRRTMSNVKSMPI